MLSVISCSGGVSEEEFKGVVNDLETEKAVTESLESELAAERVSRVRLAEAVDRFESRIAELESEIAKERAGIAGRQERVMLPRLKRPFLRRFSLGTERTGQALSRVSPMKVSRRHCYLYQKLWASLR